MEPGLANHSWYQSNHSIQNHLIYKRFARRKNSELANPASTSSSGLLIAVILLSVFVGIPLLLFLTGKFNIFNTCWCNDPNEPVVERTDKRSKRKSKERKSKPKSRRSSKSSKRVSFSEDDDQSELTDSRDYSDRYHSLNSGNKRTSHKRKVRINDKIEKLHKKEKKKQKQSKGLDLLVENIKVKTPDHDSSHNSQATPLSSEYSNVKSNVTNLNSIESNQNRTNSTSSEYAYIVYRPDTNYVAVSRSLNNLIPPNTSVIYKVDESSNLDDCEVIKSLENNLIASNVSNEVSPRTTSPVSSLRSNYFIVNSDYLLKQCKNGSDVKKNVARTKVNQAKLNKSSYFLYSTNASQFNLPQNNESIQKANFDVDNAKNYSKVSNSQTNVVPRSNAVEPTDQNLRLKPALSKKSSQKSPKPSYKNESDSESSEDFYDKGKIKSGDRKHSHSSNNIKRDRYDKPTSSARHKRHKSSKTYKYKPNSVRTKRSAKSNKKKPRSEESQRKNYKLSSKKKKKKRPSPEMSDEDF